MVNWDKPLKHCTNKCRKCGQFTRNIMVCDGCKAGIPTWARGLD